MANPKYPTITDATLVPFRAIELQLENTPDLLDRPDCPYPPHIRTFLKRLLKTEKELVRREYTEDDLEREIQELYDDLRTTTVPGDAKDQMQLIKTRADLLTRMVALKEKVLNMRQMSHFQRAVIEALESQLTPAQRNEFLEKLSVR